jgi:hypothetical protein
MVTSFGLSTPIMRANYFLYYSHYSYYVLYCVAQSTVCVFLCKYITYVLTCFSIFVLGYNLILVYIPLCTGVMIGVCCCCYYYVLVCVDILKFYGIL